MCAITDSVFCEAKMRDQSNYWIRKMNSSRLSRRLFVGGATVAGVGAAGLALVGCGDDDDSVDPTATSAPGETPQPTATSAPTGAVAGGVRVGQSNTVYESVDPHITIASPVLQILGCAMSKILRFSNPDTGELTSDLAENWEQPDPLTVTLNLRKGVMWHDVGPGAENPASTAGRALTAEDIVYNIERQQAGLYADGTEAAFGRQSYWSGIDSINTPDANTIVLNLKSPDATFLQGLGNEFNFIVQRELAEANEPVHTEISADKVIGTGPFILTEWVAGKTISAVRNDNYFLPDRPYLDGYHWLQTVADPTSYRIAFEQKDVDSFNDPDPGVTTTIHEANADQTHVKYSANANTVAIFLPHAQPPWTDIRLVQAIHIAADRRQLIQQLHNGLGKVSGPVPWLQSSWAIPQEELEDTPGYRLDREKDLTEAKALWDAAEGDSVGEITFVSPAQWTGRGGWGESPEIIAQMFNSAFDTSQFSGKVSTYGEIIPSWIAKDFSPFFGWMANIEIPDARADMKGAFHSASPSNYWGVNEPDLVDAKLEKVLTILDYEEAYELLREVQDLALANGQWGRTIMYNYISPSVYWNYTHQPGPSAGENWNFLGGSLHALESWIDSSDPSYAGRGTPALKTL